MKPKRQPKPKVASSAEERALQIATKYWSKVELCVRGRLLQGAELYVATDAHDRLRQAHDCAAEWNERKGGLLTLIKLPDLTRPEFHRPEGLLYQEDCPPPETLAAIASPFLLQARAPLTASEAFRRACDFFTEARRFKSSLPKKPHYEEVQAEFEATEAYVTVAEIEESNRPGSGRLPLLPSARGAGEKRDEPCQTVRAIRRAVRCFLEEQYRHATARAPIAQASAVDELSQDPRVVEQYRSMVVQARKLQVPAGGESTDKEWRAELQKPLADFSQNDRLSIFDLCALRWRRFVGPSESNRALALEREKKKRKER